MRSRGTPHVERAQIFVRGVPIGSFWLSEGDVVITTLEPNAAFTAISDDVRAFSTALWEKGFLQHVSVSLWEKGVFKHTRRRVTVEALSPTHGMGFELRDLNGDALHADFVNVVASPRPAELPVVVVCRKHAHSAVASVLRFPQRAAGGDRPANA